MHISKKAFLVTAVAVLALCALATPAYGLPPKAYDIYYYAVDDINRVNPPVGHWCYDCTYGTFNSCRYGYKTTNFEALYGDDCWTPACWDVQYDEFGFPYCGDRPESVVPPAVTDQAQPLEH